MQNAISSRHSIRKFQPDAVPSDIIRELVQAATLAPSAKNRQPWHFLVYTGEAKAKLVAVMQQGLERESSGDAVLPQSAFGLPDAYNTVRIMGEAPVLLVILNSNGRTPYEPVDADHRVTEICDSLSIGAAVENLLLAAVTKGLGTLWIANTCFAYPELVKYLGTEEQLVGAIALGYPAENPGPRPRKPLETVLEFRS